MNCEDEFMFNFVFDLEYIVAAFYMFLCLSREIVSCLFYSKRPKGVNWWIHPNHIYISPQATKRRAGKETPAQVFSCEFCRIFKNTSFLRTPPVATFEGEDEQLYNQTTAHDIPI